MGGGVGDCSPLYFIYRSPKEEDYVPCGPVPTHAGGKKAKTCRRRKMFRLGRGGGGSPPCPPLPTPMQENAKSFFH